MATNKVTGGRFEYLYYAGVEHRWKKADLEKLLLGRSVTEVDEQLLLLSARCRDGRHDCIWFEKVMAQKDCIGLMFQGHRMPHTWGGNAELNYLGSVLDKRVPSVYRGVRLEDSKHDEWRETRIRQTHRGADIYDRCNLRAFNCTEGWGPHPASNDAQWPAWWEI